MEPSNPGAARHAVRGDAGLVSDPIGPLREALASRYELQREIGQGAYATVYRALDLRHDRLVAIKILNVDPSSDVNELRFVREIKWLAQMQHPNILPLHDSGHVGNLLYFITPYLSGESLADKIHRERQLAVRDAVRITHEIADALQYAHSRGVVHRDIKPANILLSGGHAVVADFGVARAIDTARAHQITRTGPGSPGTPAYMSPEQLLGDREIDQRSDIYAAGCVLYEMLTGKAPFLGKEGFVRRFTEPAPCVRDVRPDVPAHVDATISKALAVDPANRFHTATEFGRSLEYDLPPPALAEVPPLEAPRPSTAQPTGQVTASSELNSVSSTPPRGDGATSPPPRGHRLRLVMLATLSFIVIAGGAWLARSRRGSSLDDNLLAVAPFTLFGADTIWQEGLTDVLVRNLDGAGSLRTVSPAVSLQHWSGYADRSSAEAFGRALKARLVVYGSVMRAGADSVRVSANVLDVREHRLLPTLQWEDAGTHIDRMTDSVTLGILRQIGEEFGVRSLSHVSMASGTTLPALKEFLSGEQYYRRTAWDSAYSAYKRAIALDSDFVLALWRAGVVQSWRGFNKDADAYKRHAGALNHGLGPRDSLLIAADFFYAEADTTTDDERTWKLARLMNGTLEEAARRYGDDAEVWWARGDALFHYATPAGPIGTSELEAIFERAIALDSTFAPAYLHPIEIAFGLAKDAHARQLLHAYLDLQPTDFSADGARIVSTIAEEGVTAATTRRTIATASNEALLVALDMIGLWPDSAEASITLARQYLANANTKGSESDRSDARFFLARQLGLRGHLREAYGTLTRADIESTLRGRRFAGELALLGFFPADTVRALVDHFQAADSLGPRPLLPWLAIQHDTGRIQRLALEATAVAAGVDMPVVRRNRARYAVESARAYLALANADTATALRLFVALPDSLCQYCFIDRLQRVQLLRATGRAREASLQAREIRSRYRAPGTVLFALETGRIATALGDAAAARSAYGWAIASWRNADPLLEPLLRGARAELQRLRSSSATP